MPRSPARCPAVVVKKGSAKTMPQDNSFSRRPRNTMYEMEYPVPLEADSPDEGIPMLIALQGYADAGQAIAVSGNHLRESLYSTLVDSINVDELLAYRARRQSITIDQNRITKSDKLSLDVRIDKDGNARPFLLGAGPEPDLK